MNPIDIPHARLANQRLTWTDLTTPAGVVSHLVAVQAQEYAGAKASLGLRARGLDDAAVERAFNAGDILRTHVLRPTWHFVAPDDIRPLLTLTAARVHQVNAGLYRQLGLDAATLGRSLDLIARELAGGRHQTRDELGEALRRAGLAVKSGLPVTYVMMYAELEGVIGSGPRRGKQFTYALLDERAPGGRAIDREEALVEVTRRYFLSHGPATVADFANWSGLTLTEARRGLAAVAGELQSADVDGQTVWFGPGEWPVAPSPAAFLLSVYDEYFIGYKDRGAIISDEEAARLVAMGNALQNLMVIDGHIVGTWRRRLGKVAHVELQPWRALTAAEDRAVAAALEQFGQFVGLPVAG